MKGTISWQDEIPNLLTNQEYEQAGKRCEEVIQSHPEQINAYFFLGLAHLLQGQEDEAQAVWLAAMFESPCDLDENQRNNTLVKVLQEQVQKETERENWHHAHLIYQQLQELSPNDINILLNWVKTSLQAGELTAEQLNTWQVVERLQQAPTKTVNLNLISDILQLALNFPVPGIEPLLAVAFEHIEATSYIDELTDDNINTIYLLGIAAYQAQKYEASASLIERVININPDAPLLYNDLANAQVELGQVEAAKANYEKVLSAMPNMAIVQYNLANLYRSQGQLQTAIEYYEKALEINPSLGRVYINLGLAYHEIGRLTEAIEHYQKLLEQYPNNAEGYNNLGLIWAEQGDYEEAESCLQKAIELKPEYADAYNNLGLLYQNQGKPEEAASYYQQAISYYNQAKAQESDYAKANLNFGLLFFDQGDLDKAEYCYRKALEVEPNSVFAIHNLGAIYNEREELDQAIEYLNQAIELEPNIARSYAALANVFKQKGDLESANAYFEKAFEVNPDFIGTYYNFAESHTFENQDDPYLQRLLEFQQSKEVEQKNRKLIEFALAKAWRDMKDYNREFETLDKANALKRGEIKYNVENDIEKFQNIQEKFDRTLLENTNLPVNDDAPTPIFILGMPRSGTTLTEQIISSHSQVTGLGELRFLPKFASAKQLMQEIDKATEDDLKEVQQQYLEEVAKRNQGTPYFTDKMPYNFMFIGLIKMIFPNAKLVHCVRHPLDICLANYQRCFRSGNYHSYNLEELGQYFLGYYQLMQHWYSLIPDFIYPLHYERLVTNQEEESRELLEFCGLDWEDKVLNFQENKRSVRTASVVQVRQKMYTSSANKWQRYAKHLELLKQFFEEKGIL